MNGQNSFSIDKKASSINPSFTAAEKKLIDILREVEFGKIEVIIQDGRPIRVDEIRKSIKI